MSRALIALTAVGWLNAHAFGGLAIFSPSAVEVTPGTPVVMDITLQTGGVATTIYGGDIVIGSDDIDFSFAYSAAFLAAMPNITPIGGVGVYTVRDYLAGGSNPSAGAGTPLALGRVTVDTTGLPLGTYEIVVNTDIDGYSAIYTRPGFDWYGNESLTGGGTITVAILEPATLSLLGIGLLGSIHRRLRY